MLYFLTAALLPALLLHASASTQEPLVYGSTVSAPHSLAFQRVITDEFSAFVRDVLSETNVRGLSLGIIKPGGSLEFDAWGNRTEDGDPVDSEVSQTLTRRVVKSCSTGQRLFSILALALKHF